MRVKVWVTFREVSGRGHAVPGLDTEARKVRRALVLSAAEWLSMAELRARQNNISPI